MSIFKESFKNGVKNQILARQEALEKHTPDAIKYLNSRNAWIRMTSAVDVDGSSGLAEYHILQGGMLYNNSLRSGIGTSTQAYSTVSYGGADNKLGMRPMPGITSIEVESASAYGSIRRVTVNFNCWDIKQLENLEILYMRPGYSVLVEWGWAPYLDNSGKLSSDIPSTNIFSKGLIKENIWKDIFDKASKNGNYDAHYGIIKNYSWSARTDGGYDCSVIIVSIGEVLESLKINYNAATTSAPSNGLFGILSTPFQKDSTVSIGYNQNVLAGMVAEIFQIAADKNNIADKTITPVDLKGENYNLFRFNVSVENKDEVSSPFGSEGYQIYISLRDFVRLLNKYILLQDEKSGKPLIPLSVQEADNKTDLLCLGHELQFSTDPTVCLIGNNGIKGISDVSSTALQEIVTGLEPTPYWNTKYTLAIIGNIYVNLEYIYKLCTDSNLASQDKQEKNDINAYDFLKNMMNGISAAIGNVATFDIFNDPSDGVARIIDINFTGDKNIAKNAFTLQIQNTKSTVRNYSLKSKIFPEQSTQIAIGAQAEGGALGTDSNTMSDFNKNLKDRIMPAKVLAAALNEPPNNADKLKNVAENFKVLADYVSNLDIDSIQDWWSSQGDFNAGESSKYANALKDIINYTKTFTPDDTKNRAIIPTELSIEMDGIGGIIIGNLFKIPNDLLPKGYKGEGAGPRDIAYVVTGLGHSVQNNDWITKIKGQLIILDTPTVGENFKTAAANAKGVKDLVKDKPTPSKEIIKQVINGETPSTNDNASDGGSGVSEKRGKTSCTKAVKIVSEQSTPGLVIPPLPSWASIKKSFPIINGPVPVYSIGSVFSEGNDFAYKMKYNKQTPRSRPVDYIVLHYTAGGTNGNPIKPFSGTWDQPPPPEPPPGQKKKGQASADFNVSRNGRIAGFKNFDKYNSWHYGSPSWGTGCNDRSIGIEIESFGPALYCPNEKQFTEIATQSNLILNPNEIALSKKPYRGYNIFQCHTDVQISAVANLIIALYNSGVIGDQTKFLQGCTGTNRYDILFPEAANVLKTAPSPGIITHGTGREGKMDTIPQPNLIEMLDDLHNLLKQYKNSFDWKSSPPPITKGGEQRKTISETPTSAPAKTGNARQDNINSIYCGLSNNIITGGEYKGQTWETYKSGQKVTPEEEAVAKKLCPPKTDGKAVYNIIKYSNNLIYTKPQPSTPTSVAIVVGGINYATAEWMMQQIPNNLIARKSFLFTNYGDTNLKAAIAKAKELNLKITSVSGFSRGGIEAYSVIDNYNFTGLIDPSLPEITKKTPNPTRAAMIYNPSNWGSLPKLKGYMEILGSIMGKNATKVDLKHSAIPTLFFETYGNLL
jgi:hypothetical protein